MNRLQTLLAIVTIIGYAILGIILLHKYLKKWKYY